MVAFYAQLREHFFLAKKQQIYFNITGVLVVSKFTIILYEEKERIQILLSTTPHIVPYMR